MHWLDLTSRYFDLRPPLLLRRPSAIALQSTFYSAAAADDDEVASVSLPAVAASLTKLLGSASLSHVQTRLQPAIADAFLQNYTIEFRGHNLTLHVEALVTLVIETCVAGRRTHSSLCSTSLRRIPSSLLICFD